tara:strand:+ start:1177 stop:1491 length:315 start_codon:yes stop_codon:yes gene_type:complete
MTEPIIIDFVEKRLTYNKFANLFKDEFDKTNYQKIISILEENNIEDRLFNISKKDTYYHKISSEIFVKLKEEKAKDPIEFNKKYNNKSMLAIKNMIWSKEYKNK